MSLPIFYIKECSPIATTTAPAYRVDIDRQVQMSAGAPVESAISGKMTSVIVTIFTTAFTLQTLYTISTQRELWVAIFAVLLVFVFVLQRLIAKCCYGRAEQNDVDKMTLYRATVILQLTVSFVIVKIIMDIANFLMAISVMHWQDYVNILTAVIVFVLAIFSRLEF